MYFEKFNDNSDQYGSEGFVRFNDNTLHICIHGTNHFFDWLKNFHIKKYEIARNIKVHYHWYNFYTLRAKNNIDAILSRYDKKVKAFNKVYISGHSMGGAIAVLLSHQYPNITQVDTFGAPAMGNKEFCDYIDKSVPIYRHIFGYDIVPYLLFPFGFRAPGIKIKYNDNKMKFSIARLFTDHIMPYWYNNVIQNVEKEYFKDSV